MDIKNIGNLTGSIQPVSVRKASQPSVKTNLTDTKAQIKTTDSVDITRGSSTNEKASAATKEQAPVRAETVTPKEQEFSDLPLFRKDLYKVHSDGKTTKVTFIYDTGGRESLKNLKVIGSWDNNTGRYTNEWKNSAVALTKMEDGRYGATITLLDDGQHHDWRWGVLADAPSGKNQWAVFEESSLKFNPKAEDKTFGYSPTNYHKMGAYKDGESIGFRYWAPNARNVKVKVWDEDPEKAQLIQMEKDDKTGMWSTKVEGGWKQFEGKNYVYNLITSEGKHIDRTDPYTRQLQGVQRGINTIYLHPRTGKQVHQFNYEDGKKTFTRFTRFEVQDQPDAVEVNLKFFDESGKQMTKADLEKRLGGFDSSLVGKFHEGKFNDFYSENIDDKGKIKLVKQGNAWASMVHNKDRLIGLKYQFEVYKKDDNGKLYMVGDTNKDGVLQPAELKATNFNDPFTNTIQREIGSERAGIITNPAEFDWKNDNAPRMADKQNKYIIYQLHVGSIFGDAKNVQRSTFKDVTKRLEYFKELGVNTLELLPTNANEGTRDWGYIGTNSFAQTDNYGYVDDNGKWVNGTEAVKQFIDTAHGMGFNVVNDVVYNHFGGEFNQVWDSDGEKNPWFNWKENGGGADQGSNLFKSMRPGSRDVELRGAMDDALPYSQHGKTEPQSKIMQKNSLFKAMKDTPWGAMPAFDRAPVRDFVTNNAMMQIDELHFDGLRFDFTHPIHDQAGGGTPGWTMLRKTNRLLHFFHPNVMTSAEEFPQHESVTKPAYSDMKGGIGFNNMWNTEFQHKLVHSHHQWGALQEAAHDVKTNMDKVMNHMIKADGFENAMNSVTVISNHDEVGNADRIINVAENHREIDYPSQWGKSAAKFSFGVGMLSPGIPIYFQGTESLATNRFTWGKSASWDVGTEWMDIGKNWNWNNITFNEGQVNKFNRLLSMPKEQWQNDNEYKNLNPDDKQVFEYIASQPAEKQNEAKFNVMRKQHSHFCGDITKLRASSDAFDGDAEINRVYTHNDNGVIGFHRKKNGEEFLVFGSLNKHDMPNYNIPLMDGKWKLVFNSDDKKYGGNNVGYGKEYVDGNQGSRFDLPAGGLLVYKKV